jgi:hypothetical protein
MYRFYYDYADGNFIQLLNQRYSQKNGEAAADTERRKKKKNFLINDKCGNILHVAVIVIALLSSLSLPGKSFFFVEKINIFAGWGCLH